MLGYYLNLALRSFRRNKVLAARAVVLWVLAQLAVPAPAHSPLPCRRWW